MDKKRIVKDYENLPEDVTNQVKMAYPAGFADHLVSFTNKEGKRVSALPFETKDIYYLIRMTITEAHHIIEDDEDYDDEGTLRDDFSLDDTKEEEIVESSAEDEEEEDPPFNKRRGHNEAYEMDDEEFDQAGDEGEDED
jgi:DNA-directed RNA polymerase subunit delta